jgi:hypothetical protein
MISRFKLEIKTKSAADHISNVSSKGTFEKEMVNRFITST